MNSLIAHLSLCFALLLTGCGSRYTEDQEAVFMAMISGEGTKTANDPQLEIAMNETKEIEGIPGKVKCVQLKPHNFSEGKVYELYQMNLKYDIFKIGNYIVEADGNLKDMDTNRTLDNNLFFYSHFMIGEPIYVGCVSPDRKESTVATIVPRPIEAHWEDQANATAHLIVPTLDLFVVSGQNFEPNESFTFISKSYHEVIPYTQQAGEDGRWKAMVAPGVKGKGGGICEITIKRQNGKGSRKLMVPYESEARKTFPK